MQNHPYEVVLEGYRAVVWASNGEEATILVQAEAIRQGRNYKAVSVSKKSNRHES